ncbi:MAG: four helix bundle protein [Anaerolineales bacterium]|nr:four helix bundle protein [Anaerolineales bacterium]MCL4260114.1 four helix bundle protein [Anaerolineales bacterium]
MTVMNLDKLEVWVRSKDFALAVYKDVVPHLPSDEKWNLTQQLKRAAQSIPANIAEGHGRFHFLDNVRFCYIARGSLTEVQSHMTLAYDLGYLPDEIHKQMTAHAESIGKQLNNYIAYLKRSKQGEKEFPQDYSVREESEPYIFDDLNEDEQNH